ncbi:secretory lipase domain-containing protein [Hirsutella rhossiliensis]|uniref:Secretory lipase domain-containing protein n=2 Tax=Hirsutella rhossiliensis TaxID=111463 RepID=A0A9P8SKN1_9HYPO|nr:secretory lipase domain-containing protein [Hirsutella rhossiliensis]KAH0966573.1 secretory lipase domain-containing protein [Hirsutella rhossiliensis]
MVAFGLRLVASLAVAAAAAYAAPPPVAAPPTVAPAPAAAPLPPGKMLSLASLTPPSKDPFYAVPDDVEQALPGAILRHRAPPNPIAGFGILPISLQATHQILYRTIDSLGNATATVLTVLIPYNADLSKVLSYQVAEDAATIDCAPSYAFQFAHATGPDHGTILTEAELLLVEAALEQGWVVIAPDFLGPKGAFLANELAGHATLDGVRAAINSASFTGISNEPTVTMWGYSGGSLASLWAAELQPTYAPELSIAGAAVGGTVPNIATVVKSVNKKGSAGLIPTGILGLANQHPDLDQLLEQHVLPQYRAQFYKPRSQCFMANNNQFANKDVVGMLDDPSLIFRHPLAVTLIAKNALGSSTPKIPIFVYKSTADEISPVSETDSLVRTYCAAGASVEYQRDAGSDHGSLAVLAAPKALSWLIATMNGQRRTGCVTRTVPSSLLDPAAIELLPKILIDALLSLLGKRVGPIIG